MAYGDRNRGSSVFDGFTLSPLPYPVLMILALILIFLGVSWYFSYEEVVESAQVQLGWLLFATPVVLILIVRWLSSMENTEWFSGWDRRRRTTQGSSEGSSPWGVAALIVVLLILMQYQSIFRDNWVLLCTMVASSKDEKDENNHILGGQKRDSSVNFKIEALYSQEILNSELERVTHKHNHQYLGLS
ncbi:hypothetical protein AHAS_Ahas13G0097400 [Arachis hypogaea]